MTLYRSRDKENNDIWPGFVDVLTSLLMIIVFLLTFVMIAQYFLSQTITGQNTELDEFRSKISQLTDLLNMEKVASEDLTRQLKKAKSNLASELDSKDKVLLEKQQADLRISSYDQEIDLLKQKLIDFEQEKLQTSSTLTAQQQKDAELIASLTQQVTHLSTELQRIVQVLDLKEKDTQDKETIIKDLGEKLNKALLQKVEELESVRSEFFGKLQKILKNQKDVLIQGDRFVFQSEVLFTSASAILNPEGEEELARLASILKEVMDKIPTNIPWILRVDGHTDRLALRFNLDFKSNWELSTARALSVVHFLIKQGIAPDRLAATGFGEYHPLDTEQNDIAYRKNRRIEFKLTNR
ncbi:MAG: peptidoglycan -binding protein [Alphaproteobacteria bacterium]|nr:peptidoglycan -binding protein [Alphaproteobacteria bacterium]